MITVVKPAIIPKKLQKHGKECNDQNRKKYDADATVNIKIKNSIYGHSSVKKILKNAQFDKCCFCEKKQIDENGAVEHFRPKGGFHSNKKKNCRSQDIIGWDMNGVIFILFVPHVTQN